MGTQLRTPFSVGTQNPWVSCNFKNHKLVGGLEHEFYDFPFRKGNVIIPTDELHHFSEGRSTTNQ
jgi:hypothetical protein